MSDSTFHFAEEYVQRGYSVIPLIGKIPPAGFCWSAYQRRRTTLAEIRRWFRPNASFRYDIGIVTGPLSALTVVDIDSQDDVLWWTDKYPQTPLTAVTGRRGSHMYYRANPAAPVKNRAGVLGRKIDIRGDGGYVVAPPSVHEATGERYMWQFWENYCLHEIPIFDAAWFATEADEVAGSCVTRSRCADRRIHSGPAYISHIYAVSGHGGHNATFRAACSLREAGLTPDEALAALTTWNETNCRPRWSARDLAHKVEHAFRVRLVASS